MKEKAKEISSILFDIIKVIILIIIIFYLLNYCDKNEFDDESLIINVCGEDIYINDYYNDGIDWDLLSKDIDKTCEIYYEEYYYENPKDVCTDYISNNKEDICEE